MTVKTLAPFAAAGAVAAALSLLAATPGNAQSSRWGTAIDNTYGSYYDYAPGYSAYSAGPAYGGGPLYDYASPYGAGPGWTGGPTWTMETWGPAYPPGCGAGRPHC